MSAAASLPLHLLPLLVVSVIQEGRLSPAQAGWIGGSGYMIGQLMAVLILPAVGVQRIPRAAACAARGFVQIWSGLLCGTERDWSLLVGPPVNVRGSNLYSCFEGIVESDRFRPLPLFVNIQLIATDVSIEITKGVPLFQVQPLMRRTYDETAHKCVERDGLGQSEDGQPSMTAEDWSDYRKTIRVEMADAPPEMGQYTAATRKRNKHE